MMELVDIGPFKVMKQLPDDTKLMASWGAVWTFGGHSKNAQGQYVDPLPLIRDNKFWICRDPLPEVAQPGTEVALVIEVRTVNKGERSAQRNFCAAEYKVVVNADGKAWCIPANDYWDASRHPNNYPGRTCAPADLTKYKMFNITDLIGEAEFKKLMSKIKTIVRKI